MDQADRVDFDKCLLLEYSWVRELEEGEYEVEELLESRKGKKTRYGRQQRVLVRWKGFGDPSWIHELALNCGSLLRELERKQTTHSWFKAMQSHEIRAAFQKSQGLPRSIMGRPNLSWWTMVRHG